MDYSRLINAMKKYGATEHDICKHSLGVLPEQINENVIIAPAWEPDIFSAFDKVEALTYRRFINVWNVVCDDKIISYIRTGIGSQMILEGILPLGLTKCKKIVFIGSAGALNTDIGIGDLVIPEFSICGDGASRYISSDDISRDVFGEKEYPNLQLFDLAIDKASDICTKHNVNFHIGRNFSIDTIAAQFSHIDTIIGMGCNVIEMETAVAFRMARLMNIPMIALFSISDNVSIEKSLVAGRTQKEMEYREYTRRELFPKIILSVL